MALLTAPTTSGNNRSDENSDAGTAPTERTSITISTDASTSRVLRTRNEIMPFLTQLNVLDDQLKDIMDTFGEKTRRGAELHNKIIKSQKSLQLKLDDKFLIEKSPEGPEKVKNLKTVNASITYYRKKIERDEELIVSINLQIVAFDIVGKRASHMIDMMKLFDEYQISLFEKVNIMMASINLNPAQ